MGETERTTEVERESERTTETEQPAEPAAESDAEEADSGDA
jgi:hypothetical protein